MSPSTVDELLAPHLDREDGTSKGGNVPFTCQHCYKLYRGSLTRQVAHLLGQERKGIAICKDISKDTRRALQEAYDSLQSAAGGSSSGSHFVDHAGMLATVYASTY